MLEELRDINYKQKYRASSQLKDAAEKASDERDKSALTIIGGALSLGYNHSECNYRPLIRLSDGRRSYAMEDIDSGAIDVLKEAVDVISPAWMRAQLSDIIWIQTSDHSYAEYAIREYISVFENVFDEENWVDCFDIIQHVYDISIKLGKKSTSFLQVRETINSALKKMDGNDPLFLSIKLIELSYNDAKPDEQALYLSLVQRIYQHNKSCADEEHVHITEASFQLLCRLLKRANRTMELQSVSTEMAQYYAICGKQLANRDPSRIHRAIDFIQKACGLYNKSSDKLDRQTILDLRALMSEYQRKALSNMASIPFEFDAKPIYTRISQLFEGLSLRERIVQFGLVSKIYKKEDVKKQVLDNQHKFLTTSLFTSRMLNDEGHTVEVIPPLDLQNPDGNPDVLFKHMIKYVSDCRNLDEAICLQFAYGLVKNERSVSIDNLSFLIDENAIIPNGRNEIIKFGIHLGLNGNLYAAMHILLPQMEHIFRNLVALCGDTVSFININDGKDGCEEYKPLSQLFRSDKLRECYDENIIFTFQSIMDERAGANLRNQNAHGLMSASIGNSGVALCFLSLTIKFLSLYSLEANKIMKKLSDKRKAKKVNEP